MTKKSIRKKHCKSGVDHVNKHMAENKSTISRNATFISYCNSVYGSISIISLHFVTLAILDSKFSSIILILYGILSITIKIITGPIIGFTLDQMNNKQKSQLGIFIRAIATLNILAILTIDILLLQILFALILGIVWQFSIQVHFPFLFLFSDNNWINLKRVRAFGNIVMKTIDGITPGLLIISMNAQSRFILLLVIICLSFIGIFNAVLLYKTVHQIETNDTNEWAGITSELIEAISRRKNTLNDIASIKDKIRRFKVRNFRKIAIWNALLQLMTNAAFGNVTIIFVYLASKKGFIEWEFITPTAALQSGLLLVTFFVILLPKKYTNVVNPVQIVICLMFLIASGFIITSFVDNSKVALLGISFVGAFYAMINLIITTDIVELIRDEQFQTNIGLAQSMGQIGSIIGSITAGFLVGSNYDMGECLFVIGLIITASGCFILYFYYILCYMNDA